MSEQVDLDKYERWGAYHFKWYGNGLSRSERYVNHVNYVRNWITDRSVLDVGAGEGLIASVIGAKGVDHNPRAIALAKRKGVDVVLGNAYDLQFPDGAFDAVFMGDVLEHFEFPTRALTEVRRVLRKHLYLAVPIKRPWKDPLGQYYDWTPEELQSMVEGVGFLLTYPITTANRKMYGKFRKV